MLVVIWSWLMIGSYIFRSVDKAKATDNLKMNGKGVKNSMANDDDNKDGNGQLVLDSRTKTKKPSMYKVIMLNDDYTPMEFVVHVLQKFFGRSSGEATQIMLNVHQRGIGVCGVYSFEIAESKAQKTIDYARKNDHPLQLQLEKE
jgi:ATP-dependent Clp protease adaptor protein ClpS